MRLGEILNLPVVHLDSLFWKPGWVERDRTEWAEVVRRVVSQEAWIMDGNYSGTLAARLEACDTVVFLDLSRSICVWRVLKRLATHHGKVRPEMPDRCPEKLNIGFLWWIWTYPVRSRTKVLALLDRHKSTKNVIHLRTRRDVERFLSSQRAANPEVAT